LCTNTPGIFPRGSGARRSKPFGEIPLGLEASLTWQAEKWTKYYYHSLEPRQRPNICPSEKGYCPQTRPHSIGHGLGTSHKRKKKGGKQKQKPVDADGKTKLRGGGAKGDPGPTTVKGTGASWPTKHGAETTLRGAKKEGRRAPHRSHPKAPEKEKSERLFGYARQRKRANVVRCDKKKHLQDFLFTKDRSHA